jgi:Tripartite tricarboxylate transporter family receptor
LHNLTQLVAMARARPESVFYAANNRGSLHHLAAEFWRQQAGVPMTFVPYAGVSAGLQDLHGGRVSIIVESVGALSGPIRAGTVIPLAVASPVRLGTNPDLPTVAETYPGFTAVGWVALSAPRGTPPVLIHKISRHLQSTLSESTLLRRFEDAGCGRHHDDSHRDGTVYSIGRKALASGRAARRAAFTMTQKSETTMSAEDETLEQTVRAWQVAWNTGDMAAAGRLSPTTRIS